MTESQCQNTSDPNVPAECTHGGSRISDSCGGGGLGDKRPDRVPVAKETAVSIEGRRRLLASVPLKWRKLFARSWSGSRKAAIRSNCLRC